MALRNIAVLDENLEIISALLIIFVSLRLFRFQRMLRSNIPLQPLFLRTEQLSFHSLLANTEEASTTKEQEVGCLKK